MLEAAIGIGIYIVLTASAVVALLMMEVRK